MGMIIIPMLALVKVPVSLATAGLLVFGIPAPASAEVAGRVLVMTMPQASSGYLGAEVELGPRLASWSVGAAAFANLYSGRASWSASDEAITGWFRQRLVSWDDQEVSALIGANYQPSAAACIDVCEPNTPYGAVVGASWIYRAEKLWLRITPHYVFPVGGSRPDEGAGLSTIAWAEFGVRLTPHLDLALRISRAPIEVVWNF